MISGTVVLPRVGPQNLIPALLSTPDSSKDGPLRRWPERYRGAFGIRTYGDAKKNIVKEMQKM